MNIVCCDYALHMIWYVLSWLLLIWYSYMNEDGKQLVASGDTNAVELVGAELVIKRQSNDGTSTKTIGSREFLRYYRQKPRPTPVNNMAITAALASRFVLAFLHTVSSMCH